MTWWLVSFGRCGPARYLSHLDTARVVQRMFARADIPLALSQGMRPKPRLSLPLPLPVGASGTDELAVVEVAANAPSADEALPALGAAAPAGVEPLRIAVCGDQHPRPQAVSADYICTVDGDAGAIVAAVERYGREDHAIWERVSPKGRRRLDLKEYVIAARAESIFCGASLGFTVAYRADGAARPQEFVGLIAQWARVDPSMRGLERRRIVWRNVPPAYVGGERRSVLS